MRATDLNTAVFTFGRMNPPTVGHARLVDMIKRQPGKPYVFLSHTQKPKTDPLSFQQKLKYAKQSFTGVQVGDPGVTNIIGALQALEKKGYSHVIMVVGSDRVKQFQEFLPKYNGKDFKFDSIKIVSAGERDPDAEGVEGMSASKLKKFAVDGDFESFKQGVVNQSFAKDMYDDVRAGMGVSETVKENIQIKPLVYVDMDGVIADFFSALAKFRGVDHWKAPGGKFDVEDSITAIAGTNFFSTLPVFPTANQLISTVKSFTGGSWNICSSPLRNDHENSKKHKVAWLKDHGFDPTEIIITGRKESYAKDKTTGTPNILIDDKPSNIERWQSKNGIGIRYQANQDSIAKISTALKLIQQYMEKYSSWTPELVAKVNQAVNTGTMVEHGGRVIKGINTTVDVGVDAIKKQSAKFGFNVTNDGVPPTLQSVPKTKKLINVVEANESDFQNLDGKLSLTTLPGTKKWQKMKKNSKPGTLDWFKTWKTLPLLTKGRKNHYMPPVKERLETIQHNLDLLEKWSKKYKDSVDCSNPKGFSQRAHCDGRKKNEATNGVGHQDLLTMPQNTIVIDTPGELDWYKIGQHFPTLDKMDPREFGQSESDMVITFQSEKEKQMFLMLAKKLGLTTKDIGGTTQHPEIHKEVNETIRKQGSKYVIYSKDHDKKLGTFDSRKAAEKRLKQIEYFKHVNK